MNTDTADELRTLRFRAYGPSADLHEDAAALRRLRELEARARGDELRIDVPREDEGSIPEAAQRDDRELLDHLGLDPAPPSVAPARSVDATARQRQRPPQRPRLSTGMRLLWGASVVATAGIAGVITAAIVAVSPVAASSGAPQIATLEPSTSAEVPAGWFGAGPSSRVWEFQGLTLFETASAIFGGGGSGDCFTLLPTSEIPAPDEVDQDSWSISGSTFSACRAGAFPASVAFFVDSSAPEELRSAYPDSAIQFVKQGDRIGVFLDGDAASRQ